MTLMVENVGGGQVNEKKKCLQDKRMLYITTAIKLAQVNVNVFKVLIESDNPHILFNYSEEAFEVFKCVRINELLTLIKGIEDTLLHNYNVIMPSFTREDLDEVIKL